MKSTVEEIRRRFDADVERFSNLETGQSAAMDSRLVMDLITDAAARVTPQATEVLDIGCGAGNFTLRLLERMPGLNAVLLDLSRPMLERAADRVGQATSGQVATVQADIREVDLGEHRFDVILASAVLHHLREESEWRAVFRAFHQALRPGGSLWIYDLVESDIPAVDSLMRQQYSAYLVGLKDEAYRDAVFAYIEQEDTPRSLRFQLDLLHDAGFRQTDVLHKHACFAAFGAVRGHDFGQR